ncbi:MULTISPECIES: magnesium transporter [Sporosarcina]|uniref:Magnesium transporter MgtE n=2 Tax=Sporosarcina newyorkensis TaxID=759851 RepID=A0A1T4Y0H9_9BACL|nr:MULTISPECIES: magnesium transporter [Sporosarcina]EGQ26926.1 divalent cation transporter [Sporosarcina newyorkensis 2681]MBY0221487.1 magnesium transporter [Sporosarcina aquimarina]SKA95286.1 magnesium transporter [Sporosarcina newyorkensis]
MPLTNNRDDISRAIIKLTKDGNLESLKKAIDELEPSEVAAQYRRLPRKRHPIFLEVLDTDKLIKMLGSLTRNEQLRVLELVGPIRSTELLDQMKSEDLSYLLSDLPDKQVEKLIAEMRQEEKKYIRQQRKYPKDSAGRIMRTRYVWVHQSYSVTKAVEKLKHYEAFAHYLNYVYIINDDKQLVGVLSYKDLLLAEADECVKDIMQTSIAKVFDTTKQGEVAKMIGRFDFVSLPVVNENNILIGIIRADEVLDIVVREADKDIEMLFASGKSIDFHTKPLVAAYRRLPWLILLLFIGLVSGSIISRFEETLEAVVALAFFMPMIAGMTGNTGTQSLAVVVRGLVSEDMTMKKSLHLVFRELIVGVILGVVCGAVISVIAYIWQGSFTLGLVVGSSLIATLIIGTIAGTVIPLILNKFKVDPAVASGPLITTINDILSLLIYFGIATMFISKLM